MRDERHDALCELMGHDSLCPKTEKALVPHDPGTGKWLKGKSGNVYGPRRIRAARALIAEMSDGGRQIIEHLFVLAGIVKPGGDGPAVLPTGPVQVRATIRLSEILWGRQIKVSGKVEHAGQVEHQHGVVQSGPVPDAQRRALVGKLTDEQLAALDELQGVIDAEFTEVPALPAHKEETDGEE